MRNKTTIVSLIIFLVMMLTLAACTPDTTSETPTASVTQSTGVITTGVLEGQVKIGPRSPEDIGKPYAPEVYQPRKVMVYDASHSKLIRQADLDEYGNYNIELTPGTYIIDINYYETDRSDSVPRKLKIQAKMHYMFDISFNTGMAPGSLKIGEHLYFGQQCVWGDTLACLEHVYQDGKLTGHCLTTVNLKTLERKQVLQIPEDRMAGTPSIYQNKVVFATVDKDEAMKIMLSSSIQPPPNYDVFLLDLDTGEVKQLTTGENAQTSPRIYGDTVIWLDARNTAPEKFPLLYDIYSYDLKTGKETRITANTTAEYPPVINGNYIAWTDMCHADIVMVDEPETFPGYNSEIYVYDLATGEERRITTSHLPDQCPDIDGNRVTWIRHDIRPQADIFMYDMESGQETQVSHSSYASGVPSISGDRIVWSDARASRGNTSNDVIINGVAPSADIYLYDLETQKETRLTNAGDWQIWLSPVIFGNHVVYTWSAQTGGAVYAVNLSSFTASSLTTELPSVSESELNSFSTDNLVLGLLSTNNELWAATSGGVIRMDMENGIQRKYNTQDGLSSNNVREIIRDSRGNIWVTCYVSGVSRFDGDKWESFTVKNGLCSDDVITLAADEKGGVWVSAFWGVSYYDGQRWSSYSNVSPDAPAIGGPNPMKDCQNLTIVDAELSAVDVIFVDSQGGVWFSSRHSAVTSFDGKNWNVYSEEDGLARGAISAIYEDDLGSLWFGTGNGNVCRFDGIKWQTLKEGEFWPGEAVPRPYIKDIKQDDAGNTWVAAYKGGISRLDGASWQTFTANDGLASNNAETIFTDHNGKLGVITDKGVCLFNGNTWQVMTTANGLPEGRIRVVASDDTGDLWFGGEEGVSLYRE